MTHQNSKRYLLFLFLCTSLGIFAQTTSITYESNGKTLTLESNNPFTKFIGEWTLKGDDWSQNWGQQTEHIKIPGHHTVSTGINTKNSLISIIDGPEPNGHIFWSYNPNTKEVEHLSSFGEIRAGKGKGTIDDHGNVRLKLFFEGEPSGTYRMYTYTWLDDNEYELKSVQFDENNNPTGLFYGGNFIRIKKPKEDQAIQEIESILKILDDHETPIATKLNCFSEDLVHMAPNNEAITSKNDLSSYLKEQDTYGYSKMQHQIIKVSSFEDVVIMRGQVIGTFHPSNGTKPVAFRTKNLFVFKRVDDQLKIWKVIYNMSPIKK